MLTSDLVKVRFYKGEVKLPFIDSTDLSLQDLAKTFIQIFQDHQGFTQQELEEVLKSVYTAFPNNLLHRGLIKLLRDRCEFAVPETLKPEEIREVLFLEAARERKESSFSRRSVLEKIAQQMNLSVETLEEGLYADLHEQQRLIRFDPLAPAALLHRYNLSLVQTVLFKATQLKICLPQLSPVRKRQIFRTIKFYQLLYTIQESTFPLELLLDGPLSLFHSTQKYGVQLATFFPILLHNPEWRIEANLLWGKEKLPRLLVLNHHTPLVSHYPDTGQYVPPEILEFKERFNLKYSDWIAEISEEILELGPREIAVPDFQLRHLASGKIIYLEIFGYWRKSALLTKWEHIKQYMGNQLLIAVQKSLQLDEEVVQCEHIYFFRTV